MRNRSKLAERVNPLLLRMQETGILHKITEKYNFERAKPERSAMSEESNEVLALSLNHNLPIVIALSIGLLVATLSFIVEVLKSFSLRKVRRMCNCHIGLSENHVVVYCVQVIKQTQVLVKTPIVNVKMRINKTVVSHQAKQVTFHK